MLAVVADTYRWAMEQIEEVNGHVEANIRALGLPASAERITLIAYNVLPETLVCASVMLNVAILPATIFWMARLVKAFTPLISDFFGENPTLESLSRAAGESLTRLIDATKKLLPAIAVCSTVTAVAAFALSFVTGDYSYVIKSAIYGTLGQHLLSFIAREAPAAPAVPPPAAEVPSVAEAH